VTEDHLVVVWDGAVRKQIETVIARMDDFRQFQVQRVLSCSDAPLPPRASGRDLWSNEADQPPSGHKKGGRRLTSVQIGAIGQLLMVGMPIRRIARKLQIPYPTVQNHVGRRYAARRKRMKVA